MIVVSDVDRTLVDAGGSEGEACTSFFGWLAAVGVPYCFATARSYPSLEDVLPTSIKRASGAICSDGALSLERVGNSAGMRVVRRVIFADIETLNCDVGASVSREMSKFVFLDDRSKYHVLMDPATKHAASMGPILGTRPVTVQNLGSAIDEKNVLSVGFLGSLAECQELAVEVARCGRKEWIVRVYEELRVHRRGLWWCDVSAQEADKANAVQALLRSGLLTDVSGPLVVLADSDNDISLAEASDVAFSPPWSTAQLAEVTEQIPGVESCGEFITKVWERVGKLLGR